MPSLSELPDKERRFAIRLGYWAWASLFLGALLIILWLRRVVPEGLLGLAFLFVLLFVAEEIWQPIYVRRIVRERQVK